VEDEDLWVGRSGRGALLAFLLFLAFPFSHLIHSPPGTAHLGLVVVAATVFVAVYLRVMWTPTQFVRRADWVAFAILLALALALGFDHSAEWAPLFIYLAAVCGFRLPVRAALPAIALCAALAATTDAVGGHPAAAAFSFSLAAAGVGLLVLAFARVSGVNDELNAAREKNARLAIAEERLRFARDLHDLLGHSLTLIALKSELARRLLDRDPERAAVEVAEIEQVTRQALKQLRETVAGYRRLTLADELAGARVALSAAGIEAAVEEPAVSLSEEAESILAWAVREGTTNVIRHSGARRCEIRISAGLVSADLEVVDDGRGSDGEHRDGSGLAGLAERAVERNGRVEAGPRPGGGFRLHVSVPTT
jgi:two-component system, NarL family, sensor histidine kinase DesK